MEIRHAICNRFPDQGQRDDSVYSDQNSLSEDRARPPPKRQVPIAYLILIDAIIILAIEERLIYNVI